MHAPTDPHPERAQLWEKTCEYKKICQQETARRSSKLVTSTGPSYLLPLALGRFSASEADGRSQNTISTVKAAIPNESPATTYTFV
jgi:hypothetical protein